MRALVPVALALYPLLVYVGLLRWQPRTVALLMGAVLLARGAVARWQAVQARATGGPRRAWRLLLPAGLVGGVIVAAAVRNDQTLVLFVPAAISAVLLASFGATLCWPPTQIETFARVWVDSLSDEELAHCRRVTWIWCGFFAANGVVAAWLALGGRTFAWTVYNGAVSYALIGGLLVGEMVYRAWRFRRYVGEPLDPLLRRWFPPRIAPEADGAAA